MYGDCAAWWGGIDLYLERRWECSYGWAKGTYSLGERDFMWKLPFDFLRSFPYLYAQ